MKVKPTGRLSFSVESINDKGKVNTYFVDLEENGGRGACSCEHYDYRLRKEMGCCKHMDAVFKYLGQVVAAKHKGKTWDQLYGQKSEAHPQPRHVDREPVF